MINLVKNILSVFAKHGLFDEGVALIGIDVLDEIKGDRYGGESKICLHGRLVMTNSYSSSDYSDDNRNEDWYHSMSAILFKGKPDLSFTIGYRMSGFKKDASFTAEVSYFDTTEKKYHALTATMALRTIF